MSRVRPDAAAAVAEIPRECNRVAVGIVAGAGKLHRHAHVACIWTAGVRNRWPIDVHHRDRHCGDRTLRQTVARSESETIRAEIIRCRRIGCLLYTSDAADERSSVD